MKKQNNSKQAWVFEYLAKKGKSLDTLEKAIMRMTKAETIEKFAELGWGLTTAHSKKELVSMILTELQNLGYKHEDNGTAKKAKKAHTYDEAKTAKVVDILTSDMSEETKLTSLGFTVGMDVDVWFDNACRNINMKSIDIETRQILDYLYFVARNIAA